MFIKIGSDVSHATHVQDKYLCLACTHAEEVLMIEGRYAYTFFLENPLCIRLTKKKYAGYTPVVDFLKSARI